MASSSSAHVDRSASTRHWRAYCTTGPPAATSSGRNQRWIEASTSSGSPARNDAAVVANAGTATPGCTGWSGRRAGAVPGTPPRARPGHRRSDRPRGGGHRNPPGRRGPSPRSRPARPPTSMASPAAAHRQVGWPRAPDAPRSTRRGSGGSRAAAATHPRPSAFSPSGPRTGSVVRGLIVGGHGASLDPVERQATPQIPGPPGACTWSELDRTDARRPVRWPPPDDRRAIAPPLRHPPGL